MYGSRRCPALVALLILTACSHPMMVEDNETIALKPSPVPEKVFLDSSRPTSNASPTPIPTPTPVPAPFDTEEVRFETDKSAWRKISDSNDILAYERRSDKNPYGDVVAFRGEAVIPTRLVKVATVLNTPEIQREWVDSLEEARIIEKPSNFESIGYNKTGVPWPFQDRDFVFKVNVRVQAEPPVMLIQMKSIEDARVPPIDGVVRGQMLISYFYLKELPGNQTKMVIEMAVDPKGAIPLWLVNAAQKRWPSNTLKKLREIAMRDSIVISPEIEEYFKKSKPRGKRK